MKNTLKASTATTTVLLLGITATVIASIMLFQSTDNILAVRALSDGKRAEYAALACAEVALGKLQSNVTYAGNETITVTTGNTCTIQPITSASGAYTVKTIATVGEATRRYQVDIASITTVINVASWKEVGN